MEDRRPRKENMAESRKRKREDHNSTLRFPEKKVAASQPLNMALRTQHEVFLASSRLPTTKVYSIFTANENKEVSVCESHEIPGKSSTDRTASAGMVRNLSLDALSEVKRALQKLLAEKQRQLPMGGSSEGSRQVGSKYGLKVSSSTPGLPPKAVNASDYEAVKYIEELAAKLGLEQDGEFPPLVNKYLGRMPTGITYQTKPDKRVSIEEKSKDPIPEVEWWDGYLLFSGTYADITDGDTAEVKLNMEKITIYMEHPTYLPPTEPAPPLPQTLKLTKEERRKLRKQQRQARETYKQAMIAQALLEPPKPIVKMSNLMKVLGCEATQDPTRLEMEIRRAAIEREKAHDDRNSARKLSADERCKKRKRKLFGDPDVPELIVSVYKVNNDLSHPQTKFKVNVNAHENRLTGCAVTVEGISIAVVEGGKKSSRRYQNLMLRRIDWASAGGNGEVDEGKAVSKCVLVWEGSVAKPSFDKFCIHECFSDAGARKVFSDAGVPHYWDLAFSFTEDQM